MFIATVSGLANRILVGAALPCISASSAPGVCHARYMRLFLLSVLCSVVRSLEMMTFFRCSGAYSEIYLALSSRYFLCALLSKTTFKGLSFVGLYFPSLKQSCIWGLSRPRFELISFRFASSFLLFSSPLRDLCSGTLNRTILLSLLFLSSNSLVLASTKIVSEYDQEIPQSQTADNPVAPRGRAAEPPRDSWKTN